MTAGLPDGADSTILRFQGAEEDGTPIHELRAAHVAQVLQGLVELSSDFAKAGAFGDGPGGSELLVRPAKEGSFIIEVVRAAQDNWETVSAVGAAAGLPTLTQVLVWSTKSARADVKEFDHLQNGNVKVVWQDDEAWEVPARAWEELNKRKRRRKKQLRQIMLPLSDTRVTELQVTSEPEPSADDAEPPTKTAFTLTRTDYNALRPEDEITETSEVFETEARMSAIDFDDSTRWRVKTVDGKKSATVEDAEFLRRVAGGLAISQDDIFRLTVRRDTVVKNGGRPTSSWTVLKVESHRRAARDNDD